MPRARVLRLGRLFAIAGMVLLAGMNRPALAEDETQACSQDGQAIAYGDVRAGCVIEAPTDQDIFTFAGDAGDHAVIIVTETPAGPGIVCAEARGPDNSLLAGPTCAIPGPRFNVGPLLQSGTHRIIVSEQNNDSTLTFNLSLERLTPSRNPTPLGPGDLILGREILPATDLDVFGFNAAIGDTFRVIVAEAAAEVGNVCAEVRGPDNSLLAGPTCAIPGVQFDIGPLGQSGVYQVVVTEQTNDSLLTYNVSLNCLSGTCADPLPACIVDPSYAAGSLTLDFRIGVPTPSEWHLSVLALGSTYTLWKVPLPVIDQAVVFSLPIPGFHGLGTIGILSTFTTDGGLVCTHLDTVDTGPMTVGVTAERLRHYLGNGR